MGRVVEFASNHVQDAKLENAKFALQRDESRVEEIRRGLRDTTPPKNTFDDLFNHWLAHKAPPKRNEADDQSIIRAHLRPPFTGKPLSDVKSADVDALKIAKRHLSPNTL